MKSVNVSCLEDFMAHKLASMKYPYDRESEKYYRMRGQ